MEDDSWKIPCKTKFPRSYKCPLTCRELAASDTLEILAAIAWGQPIPFECWYSSGIFLSGSTYHLSFFSQFHINQKKHEVFGNLATISSRIPQPHQRVSVCSHHFASRWNPWKNPWNPVFSCHLLFGGFLKYPTTIGFPTKVTKDDHFGGVFGYHHSRKPPYNNKDFLKIKSMRRMRRSKCVTSKDLCGKLDASLIRFFIPFQWAHWAPANQRPSLGLPVFCRKKSRVL